MPIKIDCPRCKQTLSVPSKKAGSYAQCPRCNGRFWVPPGQGEPGPEPSAVVAAGPASPGPALPLPGGPGGKGPAVAASPPGASTPPTSTSMTSPTMALPPGVAPAAAPPPPGPAAPPAGPPPGTVRAVPPGVPPAAPSMTAPAPPSAPPPGMASGVPPGAGPVARPPLPGAGPAPMPPSPPAVYRPSAPMPATMPPGAGPMTPARPGATLPVQSPAPGTARPGVVATLTPTARPGKKVARFIATDAAQSTIAPAPDGKLPELRLRESEEAEAGERKGRSMSPLLLLGALCLSVGLSIVLVLLDVAPQDTSLLEKKRAARRLIDEKYFSNENLGNRPLEQYQLLLRDAQTAHSRGDFRRERENYRRVLDMLRAERSGKDRGLTGSRTRDRELEQQISILLSDSS